MQYCTCVQVTNLSKDVCLQQQKNPIKQQAWVLYPKLVRNGLQVVPRLCPIEMKVAESWKWEWMSWLTCDYFRAEIFNMHVQQCFPAKALLSFWFILTSVTWHPKTNKQKKNPSTHTDLSTTAGRDLKTKQLLYQHFGEKRITKKICIQRRHDQTFCFLYTTVSVLPIQMLRCLTWRENISITWQNMEKRQLCTFSHKPHVPSETVKRIANTACLTLTLTRL